MSSKKVIQLEEELGQAQADLSSALDELAEIKEEAIAETQRIKQNLKLEALAAEAKRAAELNEATAGFEAIVEKAQEIHQNVEGQDPKLLGIAGQAAREGQLTILKEIFGEL